MQNFERIEIHIFNVNNKWKELDKKEIKIGRGENKNNVKNKYEKLKRK